MTSYSSQGKIVESDYFIYIFTVFYQCQGSELETFEHGSCSKICINKNWNWNNFKILITHKLQQTYLKTKKTYINVLTYLNILMTIFGT